MTDIIPGVRYVWRGGALVPRDEPPSGPAVHLIRDIEPYRSPVGEHRIVNSRSDRRDDLKRHGCVDHREIRGQLPYGGVRR